MGHQQASRGEQPGLKITPGLMAEPLLGRTVPLLLIPPLPAGRFCICREEDKRERTGCRQGSMTLDRHRVVISLWIFLRGRGFHGQSSQNAKHNLKLLPLKPAWVGWCQETKLLHGCLGNQIC